MRNIRLAVLALLTLSIAVGATAVVSALSQTATTTISSAISEVIAVSDSSGGTVNVNVTPAPAGAQTIASDVVTVSTNDAAGYTLSVAENAAPTSLISGGNSIITSAGSQTTPVVMANNTWGYRVDTIGGFGAGPTSPVSNAAVSGTIKFAAVPATASPNTIATGSGYTAGANTTIYFGVAADDTTPPGTYTNVILYTATAT